MALNAGAKILVIDDESALLHSILAYLEDSSFKMFGAENGKEGLKVFEEQQPDLVLTDLHMPVLGGLEVLNTITKTNSEIPVIVISGAGELNDAIQALRLGAWDYITKPIADLQVLEHAINKALERKNLVAENKRYAQQIEQNLKLLKEDQVAGRQVQMSLLPTEQLKLEHYEFNYKIIPSLELSGDFVEYFKITEDLYGVYVADVSGHGASSAFITVLLKSLVGRFQSYYQSTKDETVICPEKLMQVLSNELYAAKLNKYITLIYGVLNIKTNSFTYGVGGHYPNPILLSANGTAKYLEGRGFPVGIMTPVEYKTETVSLEPGDQIVIFSDGIMEVLMPGQNLDLKEKELLAIIAKHRNDIPAILQACGVTIEENKNQPDDLTILVISHN